MPSLPRFLLLSCSLALLPIGCGREPEHLRIGGVAPLTGESASFGQSGRRGSELAVEQWNARGGLLGRRIRLVVADDKGDPAEGAIVVTRLIKQHKVVGLVGLPVTKVALAGAPIAQSAGIPLVASSATNAKVTEVGDFIFRACLIDSFQGSMGARFAFQDLKARRAACLFDLGNDYPKGLAEVFQAAFTGLGGEVVGFEGHAPGNPDFHAALAKAIRARPDLIYVPDYYGDAALVVRQARRLGFRGPILGADGWDSTRLPELAGRDLENTYFTTLFSEADPSPAVQTFVRAYQAKYGAPPDGHAAMGYEAAVILLDGIRRAGTTDGWAIRDALARTRLHLVTGRMTFDARRNPIKPLVIMEFKEGRRAYRTTLAPGP